MAGEIHASQPADASFFSKIRTDGPSPGETKAHALFLAMNVGFGAWSAYDLAQPTQSTASKILNGLGLAFTVPCAALDAWVLHHAFKHRNDEKKPATIQAGHESAHRAMPIISRVG